MSAKLMTRAEWKKQEAKEEAQRLREENRQNRLQEKRDQMIADRNACAIIRRFPTAQIMNWGADTGKNHCTSRFVTARDVGMYCTTRVIGRRVKHTFWT